MPIASLRWLWAVGFAVLLPAGLGMGMLSLRGVSQMDGPVHWTIASPWLLGMGVFVSVAALFSLGLYLAQLRTDRQVVMSQAERERPDATAASGRWLWAAYFLVMLPLGIVICLGAFAPDQRAGLSTPTDWTIRHPTRFIAGVFVIACALLSLHGYIVRLKSDLRANRERKTEPPVTMQP